MVIRDVTINYRAADGSASAYEIAEARLWNIPGEPERIEGNGFAKGMPFSVLLAADSASELSGPENPWSLKLDLDGPDMELTLSGKMVRAFYWDRGDYRIMLSGNQADSLESLFDVEFPTTGPFKFAWDLKLDGSSFQVTDLEASVQGLPDIPEIQVSHGTISGGGNSFQSFWEFGSDREIFSGDRFGGQRPGACRCPGYSGQSGYGIRRPGYPASNGIAG
jgi:hypothetical protein